MIGKSPVSSEPVATSIVAGRRLSGECHEIRDPGRRSNVVGWAYQADRDSVSAAVDAATAAVPEWAATPLEDRISVVESARDKLASGVHDANWVELLTREQGKIVQESSFEVGRAPALVDLFAPLARAALQPEELVDEHGRREVYYAPVGPVAAITPWNWPVSLSLCKIIPALLAGNPVVLKPPPNTPLAVTEIVSTLAEVLPPGLIGVVQGGADAGSTLVTHPDIRKVVFTGSTANGAKIYAAASSTIKNITLELGGNDPAIVLDDADLSDATIRSMIRSSFVTSGQVCWAIKRIYVHRARYEEFLAAFRAALDELVVGHGLDAQTTMGPLNNETQLNTVQELIASAEHDGASVYRLGSKGRRTEPEDGYYQQPVLVTDIADEAEVVRSEQFGPIMPVLVFDQVEDAVRRANASPFGLCGSVWSADRERAFDVARQLNVGQAYVNVHAGAALDYTQAFGGIGQSGLGREFGVKGVREYAETRQISDRVLR